MQKSHGEGQEVHALDTWIVLRPFVELVLFEDLGPWDFYETPFFTAFSFFSIYLTHGCDWCGKYRQDMTQKYIQVYHSTFMQVNSHGFAAKDGCIALDITGTCTNVLRALWACVNDPSLDTLGPSRMIGNSYTYSGLWPTTRRHRIIESFRLKKTFKVTKPNH